MENNFDLTSFLKKNTLLKENIGGYRDIMPLKEMNEDDPFIQANREAAGVVEVPIMDAEDITYNGQPLDSDRLRSSGPSSERNSDYVNELIGAIVEYNGETYEIDSIDDDSDIPHYSQQYAQGEPSIHLSKIDNTMNEDMHGDSMIFDKGWQDDEEFPDERERFLGLGGQEILDGIKFLIDDGFELEDIINQIRQHSNYIQGRTMNENMNDVDDWSEDHWDDEGDDYYDGHRAQLDRDDKIGALYYKILDDYNSQIKSSGLSDDEAEQLRKYMRGFFN